MRTRLVLLVLLAALAALAAPASAGPPEALLAQAESEEGTEVENEGGDQSDPGTDTQNTGETGEEAEEEAGAETGAGEGEQEAANEEVGPQWTYQMARITLAMLLLLLVAMGALYYRMVGRRQGGV